MQTKIKKFTLYMILISLLTQLIMYNTITGFAKVITQEAYLVSVIGLDVRRSGNTVTVVKPAGGTVTKDGNYWIVEFSQWTGYSRVEKIAHRDWGNKKESFNYSHIDPYLSAYTDSSYIYSGKPSEGMNINTKPSVSAAIREKNSANRKVLDPDNIRASLGSSGGNLDITVRISPKDNQTSYYVVASVLTYKSEREIEGDTGGGGDSGGGYPDPDPEPEPDPIIPSEAAVGLNVDVPPKMRVNYNNISGTINVSGSVSDRSYYGTDNARLSTTSISLQGLGTNSSNASQGGLASTQISGNINGAWTNKEPWGFNYEGWASARLSLTNGDSASTGNIKWGSYVEFDNTSPSTTWSLQTNNLNGGTVPNGYYYTNTPTNIRVTFSDPEDDIRYSFLAVGKAADMDAGKAQIIYINNGGNETYNESPGFFDITNVAKDKYGYSATIKFKQPGVYKYSTQVLDAMSNTGLTKEATSEGTFTVRGDPAPPTAVISSPAYAFEGEPFRVTQASTDPNGVDDIQVYQWTNARDVTQSVDSEAAADPNFKPITNVSNSWSGKNGGTLRFPTGSAHHVFNIKLNVKDSTNFTDFTEQNIKVISDVPVASLTSDKAIDNLKENRKVIISAADSLAPQSNPILWNEAKWTVEAVSGGTSANIHEDTSQRNGNKQRVLQFDKPGVYKVTVKLSNNFSNSNPTHEDIGASTVSLLITVVKDRPPVSSVSVISGKPNFIDNPMNHTVKFRVVSFSDDGDIITAPTSYSWVLYEDYNNDNQYTSNEIIPQNRLTFNTEKTEVALGTQYELGRHNKIKAVVTTTEAFAEPYMQQLLASNGSYIRRTTVNTVETVNWIPKVEIVPPDESDINTPYEDTDIDGDTILDGKFIKAYTDDTFTITNKITDEFPATVKITWELEKKDHNGAFNASPSSGGKWISNSAVSHTLGHDGGTIKIASPGIYKLKMIAKDDCGDTDEFYVMIRIYTLPIAVLESNPTYHIKEGYPWYTKENIRFDLRSNPSIVDDEWGKAWHTMNWDLDNWDVKPLEGQDKNEIHFMNPQYTARYNDAKPEDTTTFSGRNSQLGFGTIIDRPIDIVVVPGALGKPMPDNNLQLDSTEKQQLYAAAKALGDKLRTTDKRYNVKVYEAWAAEDVYTLFRDEIIYGYFDGFENTQGEEGNRYTKEYKTIYQNNGVGSIGTTSVTGDLSVMNLDPKGKEGKFGVVSLLSGYDPEAYPDGPGTDGNFKGASKVYCNDILIAEIPATADYSGSIKAADMERLVDVGDGKSWKITGINGAEVICTEETDMAYRVEFTGAAGCKDNLAAAVRGWCGIYEDEYKWVTHVKGIEETLKKLNLRSNATKVIIYASNFYDMDTEFTTKKTTAENEKAKSLAEYLKKNQMHFMSITPFNLVQQMTDFYKEVTVSGATFGEWHSYDNNTAGFVTNDVYNYILGVASLVDNTQYRSCSFTEPGLYEITYWGTNYGGKVTKPVSYNIEVELDQPPIISGDIAEKFLRDPNDPYNGKFRATIALTGPYSDRVKRDVLTITSPDGDYIDYTTVKVTWDGDNNKIFSTTSPDRNWTLKESTGQQLNDLYYVLMKLKAQ